jgi:hypothetical protein
MTTDTMPVRPGDAPPRAADDAPLSRATRMALRRLLHASRHGWLPDAPLLEARLSTSARMVAADAHRQGLSAARMLVALKAEWAALDEARGFAMRDPTGLRALLGGLVTCSIRAYYDATVGGAAP